MARTLKNYLASHPAPKAKRSGGKTAVKRNPLSTGWAWKPDAQTELALARGRRKMKRAAPRNQPEKEIAKMATRKGSKKRTSTKKARKVTKKAAGKKANGLIPLKTLLGTKYTPEKAKLARRKLRADTAMAKIHSTKGRWEFTKAQATKAKAVLGL